MCVLCSGNREVVAVKVVWVEGRRAWQLLRLQNDLKWVLVKESKDRDAVLQAAGVVLEEIHS